MPLTPLPLPPGFKELNGPERIQYVQSLWDQIAADENALPSPESHLWVARERLREYRENPSIARPAFEALDRIAETGR